MTVGGTRMHIALYAPSWPLGGRPNGVVTYVTWLREGLRAQGHRVSVLTPLVGSGRLDDGVHHVKTPVGRRLARRLLATLTRRETSFFQFEEDIARAFAQVHSRQPIDVIEMEESFGFVAHVAWATGIPTVVKLHGPAFLTLSKEEARTPFGAAKVRRELAALKDIAAITSPSLCTLTDTLAAIRVEPDIAEHVVNPLALAPGAPLWSLERCDPHTLLFVGRFDSVKGGDLMIVSFQRLLAHHPRLRLVFVGPDSGLVRPGEPVMHLRDFIASLGDPRLVERIEVRGVLSPAEVSWLRTEALLTIVSSRRESQGYAALEAMLQGCPVVCTDTSGLGEIVEHGVTGLKARPEDPVDLAAQIARIVDDPGLGQALGSAARVYVLAHHSPDAVVRQTVDVYRRAIALQGRRP